MWINQVADPRPHSGLQLFLYVRRQNDTFNTRYLAVAEVPAVCAAEDGFGLTSCSLTLQSSGEPIGTVQVSVQYKAAKVDIYGDSRGDNGPLSKHPKSRLSQVKAPLAKAGVRLWSMVGKLPGIRKKHSVWDEKYAEEEEGFSTFL